MIEKKMVSRNHITRANDLYLKIHDEKDVTLDY